MRSSGNPHDYDVAIVGAGPIGSAAALAFAKRGAKTIVFEANPGASRRLAGEWLHPPGVEVLGRLGIDVAGEAAGDRDLVLSCLTSEALADLGPDPPDVPLDRLQQTVGSFTGFVAEGDLGPFWSIRAQRGAQRPKWIFFQRTGSGEWKIGVF